ADKDRLYVRAELSDPEGQVKVPEPDPDTDGSRLVLVGEHVRVLIQGGKKTRTYAVSPDSVRYSTCNGEEEAVKNWRAVVGRRKGAWWVVLAIPRKDYPDLEKVSVNVVHQRRQPGPVRKGKRRYVELELCPAYQMGNDPDCIPDWRSGKAGG